MHSLHKPQYDFILVKRVRAGVKGNTRDYVRASFSKIKNTKTGTDYGYNIFFYLGKEVANSIDCKAGDRILFYTDKKNPRIQFITKCEADSSDGYALVDPQSDKGSTSGSYKIARKFTSFIPTEEDMKVHVVKHEKFKLNYKDGLLIHF